MNEDGTQMNYPEPPTWAAPACPGVFSGVLVQAPLVTQELSGEGVRSRIISGSAGVAGTEESVLDGQTGKPASDQADTQESRRIQL